MLPQLLSFGNIARAETMMNIPNDYWYYALDVKLVLEAKTESNIELTSNGKNEANVEGLMTDYYETYYDYTEKEDGTYSIQNISSTIVVFIVSCSSIVDLVTKSFLLSLPFVLRLIPDHYE